MTRRSDLGQFGIVPRWLLAEVSPGAIQLWAHLAIMANNESQTWPKRSTLAAMCGCSRDTIDRRLGELSTAGALAIDQQFADGARTSNLYTLLFADPEMRQPGRTDAATPYRTDAATPGRMDAAVEVLDLEVLDQEELELQSVPHEKPAQVLFDEFWERYPRKVGKPQAAKAFERAIKRVPADRIMVGLAGWGDHWRRGEKRFIPHPTTWLNRDGWDDELPGNDSGRGSSRPSPTGGPRGPVKTQEEWQEMGDIEW